MDEDDGFLCARHLEPLPAREPQCVVLGHVNSRLWDVCGVPKGTTHLIGSDELLTRSLGVKQETGHLSLPFLH